MFMFFYCWNDYYGPYLYTSENRSNWTLSFALASFHGLHNVEWNLVMAAAVITDPADRGAVLLRPEGVRPGRDADRGQG